jgi:hypothetical protein
MFTVALFTCKYILIFYIKYIYNENFQMSLSTASFITQCPFVNTLYYLLFNRR